MGATVLLIEDYSAHRALLHAVVGRMGCQALDAPDGRTGLDLARRHRPAIIVLDLILPDLDGLEVLRRLREDAATTATPILIVTAIESQERVVEALEAGADDYVTKPFDPAVLQARMKVLLRAARLQRDLTRRVEQAEATARIAAAAASGTEVEDVCGEITTALNVGEPITQVQLFLLRDERLVGPFGAAGAAREHSVVAMLHNSVLARALCGEVAWQRLTRDELGPLATEIDGSELAAVPLRQGRRTIGLALLSASLPLREEVLRRVVDLAEPSALALAAALERGARSENEQRYRLLFEQATDGVVILDPATGACREANQTLAGWFSSTPLALVGRTFSSLFGSETSASLGDAVSAAAHGQRLTLNDLRLNTGAGPMPVEITLRRVRYSGGHDVVAVIRDLRSRDAVGRYEAASRDLIRLARTVRALNHEINNPLTCIIGLTQLLQLRLKDQPEALPQLERVLESAEHITELSKQLREIAIQLGGNEPLTEIDNLLDDLSASGKAG